MRRTLQLIGCVVAVWLAAPSVVTADPVTITSGVLTVPRAGISVIAPMTLTGSDGTRMFTFAGDIDSGDDYVGPAYCIPVCSSQISMGILAFPSGTVTYGDESYRVYSGGPDTTRGEMRFDVGAVLPLPVIPLPVPVATGETQTFSAPVTAGGFFSPPEHDPYTPIPRYGLTGSGIAMVTLKGTVVPSAPSGGYWELVRAEYQFSAPTPTPEPASFLLFASGLGALVLRRTSGKRCQ